MSDTFIANKFENEFANEFENLLNKVRETKPLIQQITNYVTINDCANMTLAIGASPIMADAIDEAEDIIAISNALVINMGIINERTIPAMITYGKATNKKNIPVILDPVGAEASKLRNDTVKRLTTTAFMIFLM